jgi:hypothetical protein
LNQHERAIERRKRWVELIRLAADNKACEFFSRYAEYLEWDGIESKERAALHKMSIEASKNNARVRGTVMAAPFVFEDE